MTLQKPFPNSCVSELDRICHRRSISDMIKSAGQLRRDACSILPELTSYDDDDWTDIAYTPLF